MTPKIKEINYCRTPSDYIEFAEQSGKATVYRRGKYARIKGENGSVAEMYENTTDLPKSAREVFAAWLAWLGIIALFVVVGLGAFAATHPLVIAAAIKQFAG